VGIMYKHVELKLYILKIIDGTGRGAVRVRR
jgi:hypothetical protein